MVPSFSFRKGGVVTWVTGIWQRVADFPKKLLLGFGRFDIKDSAGLMCVQVKIPAFTRGRCQLDAKDVEETRKRSHLWVHVERVLAACAIGSAYCMAQFHLVWCFLVKTMTWPYWTTLRQRAWQTCAPVLYWNLPFKFATNEYHAVLPCKNLLSLHFVFATLLVLFLYVVAIFYQNKAMANDFVAVINRFTCVCIWMKRIATTQFHVIQYNPNMNDKIVQGIHNTWICANVVINGSMLLCKYT